MTDENTNTHSDDDDREESDADLTQRLKEYAIAMCAWLRAQVSQSAEEIAPQLRGAVAGVSIPRRALKPLAVAGVLLVGAIALGPAAPFDDGDTNIETEEPVEGETYEPVVEETEESAVNTPDLSGTTLNALPSSYLGTAEGNAPDPPQEIRASAGSQTMNVETTVVDGEPAIVLEDDRTHDGRWVSIETAWFEEHIGETPDAAYVKHEDGTEYAAPLQVRDGSAAFYVNGFSTNTVTFGSDVVLSGDQAGDGSQFQYELANTSGVSDYSINVTGVENTAPASTSVSATNGDTLPIDIGGTTAPRDETVTLTGVRETSSKSLSRSATSGFSTEIDVGGTQDADNAEVTITGEETTTPDSVTETGASPSASIPIDVGGSTDTRDGTISISNPTRTTNEWYDSLESGIRLNEGETKSYDLDVSDFNRISTVRTEGQTNENDNLNSVGVEIRVDGTSFGERYYDGDYTTNTHDGAVIDVSDKSTVTVTAEVTDGGGDNTDFIWRSPPDYNTLIELESPDPGTVSYTAGSDSGSITPGSSDTLTLSPGTDSIDISHNGGSVDVDASWTEVTATEDPSLTVDGQTVSHSGILDGTKTETISLSPGTQSVDTSVGSHEADVSIEWTEVTQTEDPSVTVAGQTVSHSGTLGDGETVTESVDLSTGSQSGDISVNGPVDVAASWTEVTETRDPVVEVNGETAGHAGTLSAGETVSLQASPLWLKEGTNRVNISTNSPTNGPASLVGFEYSHAAETTTSARIEETTWSQTTTVSKTWAGDRANATATIPMNDRVVDVRNIEVRYNGTTWEPVAESDYVLNGTDLTVQLGDVAEGSTTEVRATGSKIRVEDGSINVLDPTTSSDTLNTRLQVADAGPNFALSVDETVFSNRVHYAENATWGETTGSTTITAEGEQTLTLPNATVGAEATVRTWPIEVAVAQDQMTVSQLAGNRDEPGLAVEGNGLAEVEYTFVDAKSATPYILWSETNEIVRDEGLASSPITLVDDNSEETLIFQVDDGSASGSGSGADAGAGGGGIMDPASGGSVLGQLQGFVPDGRTLLLGIVLIGAVAVVGRRTGVITEERTEAATSVASSTAGTVGGIVERILANEIVFGLLILAGTGWVLTSGVLPEQTTLIVALGAVPVALFLVLQQFDAFDFRIWVGSTALVGVLGIQALAPQLGETIAEEAGLIIVVGVIALGWRAVSAWRAEANTPDEVNRIEISGDDGATDVRVPRESPRSVSVRRGCRARRAAPIPPLQGRRGSCGRRLLVSCDDRRRRRRRAVRPRRPRLLGAAHWPDRWRRSRRRARALRHVRRVAVRKARRMARQRGRIAPLLELR
ncbi:hypothetical protein [Halorubrum sp. Ea1]|uniref:hypothetical protein n=1 Tax=Halorubrum sp. Ea1 TaxID=1480718 RepID=UPI0015951533|nr:hypothetical protein [Halorubrum sp. Ea1]